VTVTADRRSVTGQSLFYYVRPGLFRIELWGSFFAPRAVMVYDGKAHWSPPTLPTPGGEDDWLPLWGSVLTGEFFRWFDDPAAEVRQEGTVVWYRLPDRELAVDARSRCLAWARIRSPGGKTVELKFTDPREQDGLVLPTAVEGQSSEEGTGFVLRFSRMTAQPVVEPRPLCSPTVRSDRRPNGDLSNGVVGQNQPFPGNPFPSNRRLPHRIHRFPGNLLDGQAHGAAFDPDQGDGA
jgi:hypothetical protein